MRDNPFVLIKLLWRARRPSCVADMPALRNTFWLRRGYDALTFFGTIITATDEDAQEMAGGAAGRRFSELKNHEMIHLRQAQSTGDSWWRFYGLYLWYWLRALPLNRVLPGAAYRLNPFEIEAYAHMSDPHYLDSCPDGAQEWRRWAAIKPRERLKILVNK